MTTLGFTGTRHQPTEAQLEWLAAELLAATADLHHGACVGSDETAHDLATSYGNVIVVHPPTDERLMMPSWKWSQRACIYVLPARPYHDRNRDIVDVTDRLIALPDGPQRPHSGTWYTIDYATGKVDEHLSKHVVPVTICYPDGELEHR